MKPLKSANYVVHEELKSVSGQMTPDTSMAEKTRQQSQTIGIDADVWKVERTKIAQRAGDLQDHRRGVLSDGHRRPVACAPGCAGAPPWPGGGFNRRRERTRD